MKRWGLVLFLCLCLTVGDAFRLTSPSRAAAQMIEGLNLAAVEPGAYELVCLPLRVVGADGAPARAILRPAGPF